MQNQVFFVLSSTTTMPNFMIFELRLLPQLSEKKERRYKKIFAKQCKTIEGDRNKGFDSWGRLYTRFYS